jgi:hypothetical protein
MDLLLAYQLWEWDQWGGQGTQADPWQDWVDIGGEGG